MQEFKCIFHLGVTIGDYSFCRHLQSHFVSRLTDSVIARSPAKGGRRSNLYSNIEIATPTFGWLTMTNYELISVPTCSPQMALAILPFLKIFKTIIGILLSRQRLIAEWSITLRFFLSTSSYDNSSKSSASLFFTGSSLYTPSTFVAFIRMSTSSSAALKAAQVSVGKKGL